MKSLTRKVRSSQMHLKIEHHMTVISFTTWNNKIPINVRFYLHELEVQTYDIVHNERKLNLPVPFSNINPWNRSKVRHVMSTDPGRHSYLFAFLYNDNLTAHLQTDNDYKPLEMSPHV